MDDNDKLILSAQTQFFDQISKVRLELSQDSKEMRSELLGAFEKAHAENGKKLDALVVSLGKHEEKLNEHEEKDDVRFYSVNKWMWAIMGGAAVLGILGNVILSLWK